MPKNPKSAQFAQRGKNPHIQSSFEQFRSNLHDKQPKAAVSPEAYYDRNPSWRFIRAEMVDPFGWHNLTREQAHYVRARLIEFERRTWKSILFDDEDRNHDIKTYKLCGPARERLRELEITTDVVWSLRLSGKERVYGLMENGVFEVLWWDPEHQICPIKK